MIVDHEIEDEEEEIWWVDICDHCGEVFDTTTPKGICDVCWTEGLR